jgi:hypothetical protein
MDYEISSLCVEFVMTNPNYGIMIYNVIAFSIDGAGHVVPEIHSHPIQYHDDSVFQYILQALFFLFIFYYLFRAIRGIGRRWMKINANWYKKQN